MARQWRWFLDTGKDYKHEIKVDWHNHHGTIWWNETCAMVLETFGLPGNKYIYTPHYDYMTFEFKDERDAFMCKLLLSDRI